MLKRLKQLTLGSSKVVGMFTLAARSHWRRNRLLILAYHGISQADEHVWNPELFMTPDVFSERMKLLKRSGCNVLPLGEAVKRLRARDLPERSAAITFDDGFYNFFQHAAPILQDYNFPVTLYLTTYYSLYNRPVFDVVCSYLLWKGRHETIDLSELTGQSGTFDLSDEAGRRKALGHVLAFSSRNNLSAQDKDAVVMALAKRLKIDYEAIVSNRILHLLKPDEVSELAAQGVDIQLHTHRHRTPSDRSLFLREISDNRHTIKEATGFDAVHFCYPSGVYDMSFLPWLKEANVHSATTCDPGFATADMDPLLLPRLVDTSLFSPIEFEGWLAGVSSLLPRRAPRMEAAI